MKATRESAEQKKREWKQHTTASKMSWSDVNEALVLADTGRFNIDSVDDIDVIVYEIVCSIGGYLCISKNV